MSVSMPLAIAIGKFNECTDPKKVLNFLNGSLTIKSIFPEKGNGIVDFMVIYSLNPIVIYLPLHGLFMFSDLSKNTDFEVIDVKHTSQYLLIREYVIENILPSQLLT